MSRSKEKTKDFEKYKRWKLLNKWIREKVKWAEMKRKWILKNIKAFNSESRNFDRDENC